MALDAVTRDSGLPAVDDARVFHVMQAGVLSCPAGGSLRDIASVMAEHRVHFVVVTDLDPSGEGTRPWGVVTDIALARALADGRLTETARDLADTRLPETTPDETLGEAARRMGDERAAHLVVVQRGTGTPLGVLSTFDVVAALARRG